MDTTISILQEALSCEFMDIKNITNIVMDYIGVYKTYKAYDYYQVRGDHIEEEYTIIARSKKDAKDVLMKHCIALDSALSSDYNQNLQIFFDEAYFEVMEEKVSKEEAKLFFTNNKYLIHNVVECDEIPPRVDCKYPFIAYYQKTGSGMCDHNYTLNQSPYENKITISYEDCWCGKHYSLQEILEIEKQDNYNREIINIFESIDLNEVQYLIQKCKEDNNIILIQKLQKFENIKSTFF